MISYLHHVTTRKIHNCVYVHSDNTVTIAVMYTSVTRITDLLC